MRKFIPLLLLLSTPVTASNIPEMISNVFNSQHRWMPIKYYDNTDLQFSYIGTSYRLTDNLSISVSTEIEKVSDIPIIIESTINCNISIIF